MTRDEALACGSNRYDGEPCLNGHSGDRRVADNKCRECERIRKETRRKLFSDAHSRARRTAILAGEPTFIGSICLRGHDGRRYVKGQACVECHRLRELARAQKARRPLRVTVSRPTSGETIRRLPVAHSDFLAPITRDQLMAGR